MSDVVIIAVPARDEAATIESCLVHLMVAARHARAAGAVVRVAIAVAAHRCVDDTAQQARRTLVEAGLNEGRDFFVVIDDRSTSVGEVRSRLLDEVNSRSTTTLTERSWVFNTDADSRVPPDWITATLQGADQHAAVTGMVELDPWSSSLAARAAYDALVASGVGADGHTHVYGANLAVRWDAYQAAGGFPHADSEDHELVRRVMRAGYAVRSSMRPIVTTSSRDVGRASHGLAALLHHLSGPSPASATGLTSS